MPEIKDTLTLE